MSDPLLIALGLVAAAWLVVISLAKPRLLLVAAIALAPTQFLFVPVSDFFVSPADVLVVGAAAGLILRIAAGSQRAWQALWQHRYLVLLIAAYVLGFIVLGIFARTVVRVVMAVAPSILACELLRSRRDIGRAASALIVAAVIDGGYGVFWYAMGAPLHPVRFSGLSGVNFSAMVILTGAAILLARRARARRLQAMTGPGGLGALGLATLSQMGVVAAVGAWLYLLRRIVTRRNMFRLVAAAGLVLLVALSSSFVRERISQRYGRVVQSDGVAANSMEIRWALLVTAAARFSESPIFGIGMGSFERADGPFASTLGAGQATHNTYIEVLVEGGLIAFVCLALHFAQYWHPLRRAVPDIGRRKDVEGAAALVGLPIVLISAALGNLLLHYFFWSVCGVALAYLNLSRREAREQALLPHTVVAPRAPGLTHA